MVNKKNLEWLDKYLDNLNNILLWVFITSMVLIALIYIFNVDRFNFEVKDPSRMIGEDFYLNETSLPVISQADWQQKKSWYNTKALLAFVLIIAWMAVHPKFYKNIKELVNREKS